MLTTVGPTVVGAVVWDGIGSAIIGGVIGGLVAVTVVRIQARGDARLVREQIAAAEQQASAQIAADERRADRVAVIELASRMQRNSIAFGVALSRVMQLEDGAEYLAHDRLLDLWVGCADARALRPQDEELRVWADEFQTELVAQSNSWWQAPPTVEEVRPLMEWVNTCATAIARHLDSGTPLGAMPSVRWALISGRDADPDDA